MMLVMSLMAKLIVVWQCMADLSVLVKCSVYPDTLCITRAILTFTLTTEIQLEHIQTVPLMHAVNSVPSTVLVSETLTIVSYFRHFYGPISE